MEAKPGRTIRRLATNPARKEAEGCSRDEEQADKSVQQSAHPGNNGQTKGHDDKRLQVALVDPRPLMRTCISRWLETSTRDLAIMPFSRPTELLSESPGNHPNVGLILLNIGGAAVTDVAVREGIQQLSKAYSSIPLVLLSDREEVAGIVEAFRHGVRGYIPTTLSPSVVVGALRLVQAGGSFIPAGVLLQALQKSPPTAEQRLRKLESAGLDTLTTRQLEVLQRLQQGKPNKVIAHELNVQETTVKVYVREIMRKLKARNRTQAALLANQLGEPENPDEPSFTED